MNGIVPFECLEIRLIEDIKSEKNNQNSKMLHGLQYIQIILYNTCLLLHNLQSLRNLKLSISLTPNLLHLHTRSQLRQRKFARLPVNLEDTLFPVSYRTSLTINSSLPGLCTHQIRDNRANNVRPRQWKTALLHDLG